MALKEEIRRQRKQRKMSQTDLAHLIGVNLSTVTRWERGVFKPRIDDLTALARVFGVTEQELMYPTGGIGSIT